MDYHAPLVRLSHGWEHNVLIKVDDAGFIRAIQANADATHTISSDDSSSHAKQQHEVSSRVLLDGPVIPGVPNAHSHAFQRLMNGRAEWRANQTDSFWSWREAMYRTAAHIDPDQLCDVATHLYVEMLRAGYTHVCEFHYLHHAPNGSFYQPHSAMADALIEASHRSGIGLTLLPTLYMTGGFDGRELQKSQRRFHHTLEDFTAYVQKLGANSSARLNVGAACHSLRAVPREALIALLEFMQQWDDSAPFHIHIAEQLKEVDEAIDVLGQRPVEWLLDNVNLPAHSCLVHATHMTERETKALAAGHATVAICTTTEANLGDGLFPAREFFNHGGAFCVGSDSQISVSPIEELRWLEYGQRLVTHERNVLASCEHPNTGDVLWHNAVSGGAKASGREHAGLSVGAPADFLVLSAKQLEPVLEHPASILDSLIFSGSTSWIDHVYVRGRRVVDNGAHSQQHHAHWQFNQIAKELAAKR